MTQATDEVNSQSKAEEIEIPFLAVASYRIAAETPLGHLIEDSDVFIKYAIEMVEHIAEELCDEGSQLAANTRTASTLLYGASQLMRIAGAAMSAAGRRD
ncbi:MAG: hypothetical protein NVS9B10_03570 [Nevskia sp.]